MTIYEEFMAHKQNIFKPSRPIITDQLVSLVNDALDIDLSGDSTPFTPNGGSIGMEVCFDYKFKHGTVSVYTENENSKMEVTFYFNNDYVISKQVPFGTSRCIVDVDHDLKFIKATYSAYFCFSDALLHKNLKASSSCVVRMNKIIDAEKSWNALYFNNNTLDQEYFKVKDGIDNRFFVHNSELEHFLVKFSTFATEYPDIFSEGFSEYLNHRGIIENVDDVVRFFNLCIGQYFNDFENLSHSLKQYMFLTEMQAI